MTDRQTDLSVDSRLRSSRTDGVPVPDRFQITSSWTLWSSEENTACCACGKTAPSGSSANAPTVSFDKCHYPGSAKRVGHAQSMRTIGAHLRFVASEDRFQCQGDTENSSWNVMRYSGWFLINVMQLYHWPHGANSCLVYGSNIRTFSLENNRHIF